MMGRRCVVKECQNSKSNYMQRATCPVHRFPKDLELKRLWITTAVPENFGHNVENYGVCQLHFYDKDYVNKNKIRLLKHAHPSRNLNIGVRVTLQNNSDALIFEAIPPGTN